MKRGILVLFGLILLIGFVVAQESWDEFADEENIDEQPLLADDSELNTQTAEDNFVRDLEEDETPSLDSGMEPDSSSKGSSSSSGESTQYTQNFWLALGIGAGAVLLFLLLLYLLLRKPKNKWQK